MGTEATIAIAAPEAMLQNPLAQRTNIAGSDSMSDATNAPSLTMSPSPSHAGCLSSEMLGVYETVEVCLGWGQRTAATDQFDSSSSPPPGPNELRKCQKEVLQSCDKWLSLDASRIQSQHAVLMISILRTLLQSLLAMATRHRDGNTSKGAGSAASPRRSMSISNYAGRWEQSLRDSQYAQNPQVTTEADHGIQLEGWDANDEESIYVLRSLLNFRASRLRMLLERLWAISASHQWLAQTNMVRQLLERLAEHRDLL